MSYRSSPPKNSDSTFNLLRWLLLGLSLVLLVALVSLYRGQLEFEPPEWAQQPTPVPTATPPAAYDLARAQAALAQGDIDGAVTAYDVVIEKEPTNDEALREQSRLLIFARDTNKARVRAAQAVVLNPNNPDNLAHYCRALDWEAKYDQAFEVCFCSTELFPDHADSYAFISEIYTDLGNWRQGRNYAEQAIELDPNSMYGHYNLGYALEVNADYARAAELYDRAIGLAPNIAQNYVAAGLMYHTMGQYRRYRNLEPYEIAIDRFKRAIKLRPFDAEAYVRLGWTYYYNDQPGRALDALQQGVGVDPTYVRGWGFLANVYYGRQRYEDAIEYYPKAIELSEEGFLRRARQIEIYTEAPTLAGFERVPILRGWFARPKDPRLMQYTAQLEVVSYRPSVELELDLTCAEAIAQSLTAETIIVEPEQPITFTAAFSQTTGSAVFDLDNGELFIDLKNLPPGREPYQIEVDFWPNREDIVGFFQPDGKRNAKLSIQFEEKLTAPLEYYYQLGLAYAFLGQCEEAKPWLIKALEIEPAAWNPAWYGVRPSRCYTTDTPPTPIPTPTPFPTMTPNPG